MNLTNHQKATKDSNLISAVRKIIWEEKQKINLGMCFESLFFWKQTGLGGRPGTSLFKPDSLFWGKSSRNESRAQARSAGLGNVATLCPADLSNGPYRWTQRLQGARNLEIALLLQRDALQTRLWLERLNNFLCCLTLFSFDFVKRNQQIM